MKHLTSEQIQDFLDEVLPSGERAEVQEHLSVCPRCAGEVEGWKLLYSELQGLPELEPTPALSRQVMANVPVREPLAARVRGWMGNRGGEPVVAHLPAATLQEYLDGALPGRAARRADAHLAACEPCREELSTWKKVFGSMASLGRFAPAPGFAQRVMARVRIPATAPALWTGKLGRSLGWIRGFLPQTRRGWAVAGGIASAPTISMAALLYLVFSHPLLSLGTFTTYVSWKASDLLTWAFSAVSSAAMESVTLFQAYSILGTLAQSPLLVGLSGMAFSIMSVAAFWVLYRNLMTTQTVDDPYARARL